VLVLTGSGSARCRGGLLHGSLGGVDGQSRAQLDGFKSRALRPEAPAQRHLYATEWRVLAATPAPAQGRPAALVLGDAALPFEDERVPSRTRWNELELDLDIGVPRLVMTLEV
jgi:hypothetical protein